MAGGRPKINKRHAKRCRTMIYGNRCLLFEKHVGLPHLYWTGEPGMTETFPYKPRMKPAKKRKRRPARRWT